MIPCPSPQQLRLLVSETGNSDVPADLEAHVQHCPACQNVLSRLNAADEDSSAHAGQAEISRAFPQVPGFEILARLGRGGMGVVYKARQQRLNRVVALKMIRAGADADAEQRMRFHTEAQAAACLDHPNIVQVFEVGETEGEPFCVLEMVDGSSLDRRLHEQPLDPRPAALLLETLAHAVHYAHEQGIIHRDLKPSNVLLAGPVDALLERCRPKITDFGLAKRLNQEGDTHTGAVMGTPSYMAPEQAAGNTGAIGPGTDVYGLGAILYHAITGRPPFRAGSTLDTLEAVRSRPAVPPRRLQPRVPRDLETICLKCLEKEPAKRYPSAAALAEDLRRYLDGEPILARRVRLPERAWRWCRREPVVASLLAAFFLSTLVSLALWRQSVGNERAANQHLQDAVAAREEADVNFQGARRFLARYVQLCQDAQLYGPTTLPLRGKLFDEAMEYHKFLLQVRTADVGLRADQADLATTLARQLHAQGRLAEAETTARDAVKLWTKLVAEHDPTLASQSGLAKAYYALAAIVVRGDPQPQRQAEALQWSTKAYTLWLQLEQRHPDLGHRWDRAEARALQAGLLSALDREAASLVDANRTWFEQAAKEEGPPVCHHIRSFLVGNWLTHAHAHNEAGRWEEALHCWKQALLQQELVIQGLPGLPGYPLGQADLCRNLADQHRARKLSPEPYLTQAFQWYVHASADLDRLLRDPQLLGALQQRVEAVFRGLAAAATTPPLSQPALFSYRQALKTLEELSARYPENLTLLLALLDGWCHLADAYHKSGHKEEAVAVTRHAVSAYKKILEKTPLEPAGRAQLLPYWHHLASRLWQAGLSADASSVLEEGCESLLSITKADPDYPNYYSTLGEVLRILRSWQEIDRAAAPPREVYRRCQQRLAERMTLPQYDLGVLSARQLQAETHHKGGELRLAREVTDEIVAALLPAIRKNSKDDRRRAALATHCRTVAIRLLKLDSPKDAIPLLEAALAVEEGLFRRKPLERDTGHDLHECLINLGKARLALGQTEECLEHWRYAVGVMRLVQAHAPSPRQVEILRNDSQRLERKLRELGRNKEADYWLAEYHTLGAGQTEGSRVTTGNAPAPTRP